MGKKGVNKIKQIVQLKQVMQRWKNASLLRRSNQDQESGSSSNRRVSSGFLAVYVGIGQDQDRARFLIPTRFLSLPVFVSLLNKAEEEFGFRTNGGLVLPCEVEIFNVLLKLLQRDENKFGGLELIEFLKIVVSEDMELASIGTTVGVFEEFIPRIEKTRA